MRSPLHIPMQPSHLTALIEQLQTPEVDEQVIRELAGQGIEILDQLPGDQHGKWYWTNVVRIIRTIGYPGNAAVLPLMVRLMADINWPGGGDLAEELVGIGAPVLPHVVRAMHEHGTDSGWMETLFQVLAQMPPGEIQELGPELIAFATNAHSHPDSEVTLAAASLLVHIGSPYAQQAVPMLARISRDITEHRLIRQDALRTLACLPAALLDPLKADLEALAEDPTPEVREAALQCLDRCAR